MHSTLLKISINKLETKLKEIKFLLPNSKRTRRGWFNIFGTGLKTLFGTLDSDDAVKYDKLINELQSSNKKILKIQGEQAHLTEMILSDFNNSLAKINSNEETLRENILAIKKQIFNNNIRLDENRIFLQYLDLLTLLNDLAIEMNKQVDEIVETLSFARINVLHPSVLNHVQLEEQLSHVAQNENTLPFPFDDFNIYKYYQIMSPKLFIYKKGILIKLTIPLVKNIKLRLYKAYPYPVKFENDLYHTIIPESSYVAISDDHQWYLEMNELTPTIHTEDIIILQDAEPQDTKNTNFPFSFDILLMSLLLLVKNTEMEINEQSSSQSENF
ncbi:uncharacterized protein LOC112906142 [Agrilus planipennis]|uniref:Uncharacterized protein LOC112904965 n=1 Tax=Agrilus planipennis TaxID=224129 RepID=A0A7F5R835_AGRPL|nr:uncharacterized protein LOC112904965 [Agrilus planipennis]XP_025835641.1 uncharacterized protein LOC112906142 [Agrilus planipennis]